MTANYKITPSILSADFTCLREQISEAEAAGADWIHIDVMDGQFVPNLTMGPFIVEACRRITRLPLDVHLMVNTPERLIESFSKAGASLLYVHVENSPHLHQTLLAIKGSGCKTGVVLNPGTPAGVIEAVLPLTDVVLVMTVNPGYSGQAFLPEVTPKVAKVRQLIREYNPDTLIAVDGGVTSETAGQLVQAGAQVFIAATAVFKHPAGISAGIQQLRAAIHSAAGYS